MFNELTKNHVKELTKLQQKKYRTLHNKTIVEGVRLIDQLNDYGINFDELIISNKSEFDTSQYSAKQIFIASQDQMKKITTTKTPQNIAAVINTIPIPIKETQFLLYMDGLKAPGHMGRGVAAGSLFRGRSASGKARESSSTDM